MKAQCLYLPICLADTQSGLRSHLAALKNAKINKPFSAQCRLEQSVTGFDWGQKQC